MKPADWSDDAWRDLIMPHLRVKGALGRVKNERGLYRDALYGKPLDQWTKEELARTPVGGEKP